MEPAVKTTSCFGIRKQKEGRPQVPFTAKLQPKRRTLPCRRPAPHRQPPSCLPSQFCLILNFIEGNYIVCTPLYPASFIQYYVCKIHSYQKSIQVYHKSILPIIVWYPIVCGQAKMCYKKNYIISRIVLRVRTGFKLQNYLNSNFSFQLCDLVLLRKFLTLLSFSKNQS